MSKKGALFRLIKSLSRSEKRYFRLFARLNKPGANYLRLFDALDAQEAFDEQALRATFAGETFVKQLHVTKNYLFRLLMKCLRNYHQGSSKRMEVLELLGEAELLYQRELFDECHYSLQKAHQLAQAYEFYPLLLEVLGWERKLLLNRQAAGERGEALGQLVQQEQQALKHWQRYSGYWELTAHLAEWIKAPDPGGQHPNKLAAHPLFQQEAQADSLQARILYEHLHFAHAVMHLRQPRLADQHLDRLIEELEKRPLRIREDPSAYLTALTNKVGSLLKLREQAEIPPLLEKIRAVPQKYGLPPAHAATLKVLLQTYNLELELYRDTGQLKRGLALIRKAAELVRAHPQASPDYVLLLSYQFAHFYFMDENHGESLQWLQQIMDLKQQAAREDILRYARMLALMVHLERDNLVVLKYAVDSTRRFLKKKGPLKPFEQTLLQFFSKMCDVPAGERRGHVRRLRKQLFERSSAQEEADALDYVDFYAWIDRYLEKTK